MIWQKYPIIREMLNCYKMKNNNKLEMMRNYHQKAAYLRRMLNQIFYIIAIDKI